MYTVPELRGYKGYRALTAFHKLLYGVKMLPSYINVSYEDFYNALEAKSIDDQEKILRLSPLFVDLTLEELEPLVSCVNDPNGVPYGPSQLRDLNPKEIHEMIVAVCKKVAEIKIDLVTKTEKKKSQNTALT